MVDRRGRVIYVGRSANLRARVRSYWGDLRDRPHLRRMVARVARVEHVECASPHDAAFLERQLIERHDPWYNRTHGFESEVWLCLRVDPKAPALEVVHEPAAGGGARCFGPYLGWEPARLAAAALERLYPLTLTGSRLDRARRSLAQVRGVGPDDRAPLTARITAVLERDPVAVADCLRRLAALRDRDAENQMFESAAALQRQIRALGWLSQETR